MEVKFFYEGLINELPISVCNWINDNLDIVIKNKILYFIILPKGLRYVIKIHHESLDKIKRIRDSTNKISEINMAPKIYKVKECGNIHFSLMDYIAGTTLIELINTKNITSNQINDLFRNISTIHQILKSGHGDLSPHNIIYNGKWVFIDFLDVNDTRDSNDDYVTMLYYFSQPLPIMGQYQIINKIFDFLKKLKSDRYKFIIDALEIFLVNPKTKEKNNELIYWKLMKINNEILKDIEDYATNFFGELQ